MYTLNICYSTFCRGKRFFDDINELLQNKDKRFHITVQDNHSEDGSFEALNSIDDPRFHLRRNDRNLTSHPSHKLSLLNNNDAVYLLFSIDKDYINPEYISQFIDYLENEKPSYGYVELYKADNRPSENYSFGYNAITNFGYLSKHPSGFFWKKDLYYQEVEKSYFKNLPMKFDFWFDVVTAHLASNYTGTIIYIPLIIHAPFRKDINYMQSPTLSYNEDNIYFGKKKRWETYNIYINDLFSLDISLDVKKDLAFKLTANLISQVTLELRMIYQNIVETNRYSIASRTITLKEMLYNSFVSIKIYNKLLGQYETLFARIYNSFLLMGMFINNISKGFFRKIINKY